MIAVVDIEEQARIDDYEAEILREMEPFVKDRLILLVPDERRKWWASDYFDWMEQERASDEVRSKKLEELREEVRGLRDEDLVVLVGNTVTEEALANYSKRFPYIFPDPTHISQNPWNIWERGWTAEEFQHLMVLNHYSLLGGRVNLKETLRSSASLLSNGMKQDTGIFMGMAYPAFQEPATSTSHRNMAGIAEQRGAQTLHEICTKISGDETRHAVFYREVVGEIFEKAPERMMIVWGKLMKDKVVMPALNMTDSVYTEPPSLFEHFAGVADRIGVYTTQDYANLVKKFNKTFGIESASVSGEAAKAQNYLCNKLPKVLERAERIKKSKTKTDKVHGLRVAEPVAFGWIYGRTA